jgi:2-polyprenyl-6-methoxyphenol hydroxylase-like FAD-dependent oxidoreductase
MAQGAAMAFEDAVVLAESLGAIPSVSAALASYLTRRLPRIRWARAQTHRRDRIRSLPAIVRETSIRFLGQRIYRSNYSILLDRP